MERAWVVFSRRLGLWRLEILRRLEPFWGVLGSSWSVLEVSWVVFGAFLGRLLDILKLSWNVVKASRVV